MITAKIIFSSADAIKLFRNAGLEVKMVDYLINFEHPHGGESTVERIPILSVINPHTGEPEKLEIAFRKYLEVKKNELFLSPEKLEIYELFNKVTNKLNTPT